jgi:hypothetical protein
MTEQGIFEVYNARHLDGPEVAESFIDPSQFQALAKRRHTILIGPRGSGKTTLMKMLCADALAAWQQVNAPRFRESIQFTGIFVGADSNWGKQLESLRRRIADTAVATRFVVAAFQTHTLRSFVEALEVYKGPQFQAKGPLRRHLVSLDRSAERLFVTDVAKYLSLTPTIASLAGLRLALQARLRDLKVRADAYASDPKVAASVLDANYMSHTLIDDLIYLAAAYETYALDRKKIWCLLFDEFEIAPTEVREVAFSALRSTDRRLLFKYSLYPYDVDYERYIASSGVEERAGQGHDFDRVTLTYGRKEDSYDFSRRLVQLQINDPAVTKQRAPADVFGHSIFDAPRGHTSTDRNAAELEQLSLVDTFVSLARKDPTFANYLRNSGIEFSRIGDLRGAQRAAKLRKFTPIVTFREFFSESPRRSLTIYSGETALYSICEGNPRYIKGVVSAMLETPITRIDNRNQQLPTVSRNIQAKHLAAVAWRYHTVLKSRAARIEHYGVPINSLADLMDRIGAYFHRRLVDGPFEPDPPLSFLVDYDQVSAGVREALGRAENSGAVIEIEQSKERRASGRRGNTKRYRLTYLLSPVYGLPLTYSGEISLETILRNTTPTEDQPMLFGDPA